MQCSIAGVRREIPYRMIRGFNGTKRKCCFHCAYCDYRWTDQNYNVLLFALLKKTFMSVYYLTVLQIAARKRKEKLKARITVLCALSKMSQLNADMCEKITREAELL